MNLLVTGGAGYLGSVLVPLAQEHGHRMRVFDRFLYGDEGLAGLRDIEIVRGDVRRLQEHPTLLDGIDAVIHLAAIDDEAACQQYPAMTQDINVASTAELARLAMRAGVQRFVFASTSAVYGRGEAAAKETDPVAGDFALAAQKLSAERSVLSIAAASFVPLVARLAVCCGVSPRMRFDLDAEAVPIVHVRDAARALLALAEGDAPAGTYNVGQSGVEGKRRAIDASKLCDACAFRFDHDASAAPDEVETYIAEHSIDRNDERFYTLRVLEGLVNKPVEEGGEPISPQFIPLTRPVMDAAEEEAVLATFRSGWITSGPQISAFETAFAQAVGAPYAVATVSCTAALHLCLADVGVGAGDEVIMTPITWASTGNTVLHMGARPVFIDIEADTLNLDAAKLEAAITERTKAIMPVHMAGQPCDLDAIYAVANRHGIPVIEDAAHALGATYRGRKIGAGTRYACFSFYAIKNITTIEGGAIATNDQATAERLRLLASNGMAATAWDRYGRSAVPGPAEVITPGFKYLMGNVSAAMGLVQLSKWPAFKLQRERLADRYLQGLRGLEGVQPLALREGRTHSWHLMIVRLDLPRLRLNRDEIAQALRRENIGTGVHFLGLHLHQYYRETLAIDSGALPEATAASGAILSLPLFPALTVEDVDLVVRALEKVMNANRI